MASSFSMSEFKSIKKLLSARYLHFCELPVVPDAVNRQKHAADYSGKNILDELVSRYPLSVDYKLRQGNLVCNMAPSL